jgi:TPR repeat protein
MPRDAASAFSWWEKAARAGSPLARNALGELYLRGEGVRPDPLAAWAWFTLAADAGVTAAAQSAALLGANFNDKMLAAARARAAEFASPP